MIVSSPLVEFPETRDPHAEAVEQVDRAVLGQLSPAILRGLSLRCYDLTAEDIFFTLGQCTKLTKLDFSKSRLNLAHLPILCSTLVQLNSLNLATYASQVLTSPTVEPLLSLSYLQALTSLDLGGHLLSSAAITSLHTLTQLQHLGLVHCGLDDASIQQLASLKELASLRLDHNHIHGESFEAIAFPKLTVLSLSHNSLTPQAVASIAKVHTLKSLNVAHNALTLEDIGELTRLSQLQSLAIGANPIGNSGVQLLCQLTTLRSLDVGHIPELDVSGFNSLTQLDQLHVLNVEGTSLGDDAMVVIGSLQNLQELNAGSNQFVTVQAEVRSWHLSGKYHNY